MEKSEKIRDQVRASLEELEGKAMRLDYWRTTIFFLDKINGDLESRTVFAEHQLDASHIAYKWYEEFRAARMKFYIFSTAYDSNYDGGLFNIDD